MLAALVHTRNLACTSPLVLQSAQLAETIALYEVQLEDLQKGIDADPGNEEAAQVRSSTQA